MRRTFEERLWGGIEVDQSGCWPWQRSVDGGGYGQISIGNRADNRMLKVHRVVYESLVGPIPEGLELDHLCRNRICANYEHLEPVPHATNVRRGTGGSNQRAKTHCPAGHEYGGDNLYVDPHGFRHCRACRAARTAARA